MTLWLRAMAILAGGGRSGPGPVDAGDAPAAFDWRSMAIGAFLGGIVGAVIGAAMWWPFAVVAGVFLGILIVVLAMSFGRAAWIGP